MTPLLVQIVATIVVSWFVRSWRSATFLAGYGFSNNIR